MGEQDGHWTDGSTHGCSRPARSVPRWIARWREQRHRVIDNAVSLAALETPYVKLPMALQVRQRPEHRRSTHRWLASPAIEAMMTTLGLSDFNKRGTKATVVK